MFEKIMHMESLKDFEQVSLDMFTEGLDSLGEYMLSMGFCFDLSSCWTTEYIDSYLKTRSIPMCLKRTQDEDDSDKLLHRLQLIAFCNPGIRDSVNDLISKVGM